MHSNPERRPLLRIMLLALSSACTVASYREDGLEITPRTWVATAAAESDFRDSGPVDLSGALDLSSLLEMAAGRNPRLAAARERWLAAAERPAQMRALPDPLLSYMPMVSHVETRVGPMEAQLQLMQRIPFPGKLAAAGRLAVEEARIREIDYVIGLRDIVADIKVSYAELLYLRKAIRIVEQNGELARQLAEKAASLYGKQENEERDQVTLFDSLQAQAQIAQLAYDGITLEELRCTEEAGLNRLLSRPPEAPLGMPRDLAWRPLQLGREDLFRLGLERRQELEAALRQIGAADEAARLARLSRVPDFTIGATYTVVGNAMNPVPDGGKDALGFTLGLSLPIWETKNRAALAEAQHRREAARLDRQAQIDDLMARISQAFFRLENAERLVRLYKESLIPQAEQAMEIAEQWRDTGRDTIGRYLEAQSVWLNFQLAFHRALADYEQMVARLEQLAGTSLGPWRCGEDSR